MRSPRSMTIVRPIPRQVGRGWRARPSLGIPTTTGAFLLLAALLVPSLLVSTPGAAPAESSVGAPPATGWVEVAPAYSVPRGVTAEGPLSSTAPLSVLVAVGPSDPAGLEAFAAAASTPGSPQRGEYLTSTQVADRFGATNSTLATDRAYFERYDLTAQASADRFFLTISGNAGSVAEAFHTQFDRYEGGGRTFFDHSTPAAVPSGVTVFGVLGLGNSTEVRPQALTAVRPLAERPLAGCTGSVPLPPCAIWKSYDDAGLIANGTDGYGHPIGVVDAYDSAEPQTALSSDFRNFTTEFALPGAEVQFAYPTPAGNSLNSSPSSLWGDEDALDLEWARASAPGAPIVDALSANTNVALYGSVDWLVDQDEVQVISLSWGEPDVGVYNSASSPCSSECNASSDGSYALLNPVFEAAAAEGIGVFAASGDCGAADGTNGVSTNYPASDPWVTGVGGTYLETTSDGGYGGETGWDGNSSGSGAGCQNQGGSGGGYAPFPRPYWQNGPGTENLTQRGVPDVSADAESSVEYYYEGSPGAVGGTSLSTPLWAGWEAVADQADNTSLGFLGPTLYAILQSSSYSTAFHDITSGWNGYNATRGWDPVTGIGSPDLARLAPLLSGYRPAPNDLQCWITPSVTSGAAPLTVNFSANVMGGVKPYALYDFTFGDGNATPSTTADSNHTYLRAGVYAAQVTVFDARANSTTSYPVAIVVGGGGTLAVHLTANSTTVPVGEPVAFSAQVAGGFGPFNYSFWFGDGTFSRPGPSNATVHTFAFAGSFCAAVVVVDEARPPDGGSSPAVPIVVGSGAAPACGRDPRLFANLTSARTAGDLPGDLPLRWNASGGLGPVTTWIDAPDPYATLCQCGLFRTPGNETVTLYANDSAGNDTTRTLNVTLYPALEGSFLASTQSGPVPLTVTFNASATGGHLADAARTNWSFGDGSFATGSSVTHTFTAAGSFLTVADLMDPGGGNASEAFLIEARNGSPPAVLLTATVDPAVNVGLGAPVEFRASASGGSGSLTYLWQLSDGSSEYGPAFTESPVSATCPHGTNCLSAEVTASDAQGARESAFLNLSPFFSGRSSALDVLPSPGPRSGTTPFLWNSTVSASGMPSTAVAFSYGDGGFSSGPQASHVYLGPGNFTVVATVTDLGKDSWSWEQAVSVNGSTVPALSVQLSPSNFTNILGPPVDFTALASGGSGGGYSYHWAFGDGATEVGANVSHRYLEAGRYVVLLNATDRFGDRARATALVTLFNLTVVNVRLVVASLLPSAVTVSATLNVSCGAHNAPNCSSAPIPTRFLLALVGAAGPPMNDTVVPVLPGQAFPLSYPIGARPGVYELNATVLSPWYVGGAQVTFTVRAPAQPPAPADAALFLAVGLAVGAGAALASVRLYRDRREPPRSAK